VNETILIKYGGNAMKSLELRRAVAQEIAVLRASRRVIVVHGGGPLIERDLARLGIQSEFLRGLRVTTPEALEIIEKALTTLSKELAQEIGEAIGLTGRDSKLLIGTPLEAELGRVGRVETVNTALLQTLLGVGITPVVGCIAVDSAGEALNVNADWAAGAVAGAMAAPVIFLTDVNEVRAWIADGTISGGMIPKVEAALYALERGARSATIASGMEPGILERALRGEAGTTITV
jgi:acetylglutamate kinase